MTLYRRDMTPTKPTWVPKLPRKAPLPDPFDVNELSPLSLPTNRLQAGLSTLRVQNLNLTAVSRNEISQMIPWPRSPLQSILEDECTPHQATLQFSQRENSECPGLLRCGTLPNPKSDPEISAPQLPMSRPCSDKLFYKHSL